MTSAADIAGVPLFQGEVLLSSWSETSKSGKTVTFALDIDSATGEHPFKGLGTGKYGQKFMLVAVPITDSGQPTGSPGASISADGQSSMKGEGSVELAEGPHAAPQALAGGPDSGRTYTLANRIGMRCAEVRFSNWMHERAMAACVMWPDSPSAEERTAIMVRNVCGVKSRAEIVPGSDAAKRWAALETEYLKDTGQMAEARG